MQISISPTLFHLPLSVFRSAPPTGWRSQHWLKRLSRMTPWCHGLTVLAASVLTPVHTIRASLTVEMSISRHALCCSSARSNFSQILFLSSKDDALISWVHIAIGSGDCHSFLSDLNPCQAFELKDHVAVRLRRGRNIYEDWSHEIWRPSHEKRLQLAVQHHASGSSRAVPQKIWALCQISI